MYRWLLILFLFYSRVFAQDTLRYVWEKPWVGPGKFSDSPNALCVDTQDNIYIGAFTQNPDYNINYGITKWDKQGNMLWQTIYDSPKKSTDVVRKILVTPSGYVYVFGDALIQSNIENDFVVLKLDAMTGDTLWSRLYNNPNFKDDTPVDMVVDADDAVYVSGYSMVANDPKIVKWVVLKYASDGTLVWKKEPFDEMGDHAIVQSLLFDQKNKALLVSGEYLEGKHDDKAFLQRYASDGRLLSTTVDTFQSMYGFYDLVSDQQKWVYAVAEKYDPVNLWDISITKFSLDGKKVAQVVFDGPAHYNESAYPGLSIDAEGNIYLGGRTYVKNASGTLIETSFIAKYDVDLKLLWQKLMLDEFPDKRATIFSMMPDKEGNVFVLAGDNSTGTSFNEPTIYLLKICSNGSLATMQKMMDKDTALYFGGYMRVLSDNDLVFAAASAFKRVYLSRLDQTIADVQINGSTKVCFGDTLQLLATGGNYYRWNTQKSLSDSTIAAPLVYPDTTTTFMVQSSADKCISKYSRSASITIRVPNGDANFTSQFTRCDGIEFNPISEMNTGFKWDFGDKSTSERRNVRHHYADTGTYKVVLAASNEGCTSTSVQEIAWQPTADDLPPIPNVFSPNGDGMNDVFDLSNLQEYCALQELFIYNRWGKRIWHESLAKPWDGTINGNPAPEGVYFYVAKGSAVSTQKGSITLIR